MEILKKLRKVLNSKISKSFLSKHGYNLQCPHCNGLSSDSDELPVFIDISILNISIVECSTCHRVSFWRDRQLLPNYVLDMSNIFSSKPVNSVDDLLTTKILAQDGKLFISRDLSSKLPKFFIFSEGMWFNKSIELK